MLDESPQRAGKVFLVGAGPGDPGLLTLRGVECLQRADAILYDYLVNPRILQLAGPNTERTCLGRHGIGRIWTQPEINQQLISLARQGKMVVRLKGGDPAVFARAAEEIGALIDSAVPFEVIPGVTAALAAASYAGIPITHRESASAVALVTGQEQSEKCAASLDFAALASFPGTLMIYMGVTTAESWTKALISAGKPPQTPAAILRHCSLPSQRLVRCHLSEVPARIAAEPIRPPAIVIVGEVVRLARDLSWFEQRPLFGQTILVSRPSHQGEKLVRPLEELGAEVIVQPAIDITPPQDWRPVDDALGQLDQYDWVVFTSVNGVRMMLDRLLAVGRDVRAFAGSRLASIGPGTTEELRRYTLVPDLQSAEARAESLADALAGQAHGRRFLLPRANRGREVLAQRLAAAGGDVDTVVVYHSTDRVSMDAEVIRRFEEGEVDWVTVTSSATAGALVKLLGRHLSSCRLASISPITSGTLRQLGVEPAVEAEQYTMPGLCAAIVAACDDPTEERLGS